MWARDTKKEPSSLLHAPKKNDLGQSATSQFGSLIQMASLVGNSAMDVYLRVQQRPRPSAPTNEGGGEKLPSAMREKLEARFGFPLDDVRVHYHSDKPAELGAAAYAKGNEIHLGPGQEKHLEHEAGHVVQQKQGRVRATGSIGGEAVNTESSMQNEAECGVPETQFGNFELSESNAPIQAAFEDWIPQNTQGRMAPDMLQSAQTEYRHAKQYAPIHQPDYPPKDQTYTKNKILLGRRDDLRSRLSTDGKRGAAWTKANATERRQNFLNADVWDMDVNRAYMGGGIDAGARFRFISQLGGDQTGQDRAAVEQRIIEIANDAGIANAQKGVEFRSWLQGQGTVLNLYDPNPSTNGGHPLTVTAEEIVQLLEAGYRFRAIPSKHGGSSFQAFRTTEEAEAYKIFKTFKALPLGL